MFEKKYIQIRSDKEIIEQQYLLNKCKNICEVLKNPYYNFETKIKTAQEDILDMYPMLNLQKKPFSTSLINFRVGQLELRMYINRMRIKRNEMRNLCVSQEARIFY